MRIERTKEVEAPEVKKKKGEQSALPHICMVFFTTVF
jgi:hypothetical protein